MEKQSTGLYGFPSNNLHIYIHTTYFYFLKLFCSLRKCSVCLIVVGSLHRVVAAARVNYVLVSPGHLGRGSSCRHVVMEPGSWKRENSWQGLFRNDLICKKVSAFWNYRNVFAISSFCKYIFYICGWHFWCTNHQLSIKLMKVNRLTCPQVFIKDHSHQSWWLTLMHSIISQADDTILFLYSGDFFDQLITWWWIIEMYPCSGLARVSC